MAGTEETNPKAAAAVNRLRRWAVTEGNKIFVWGTPGDFDRCMTFYREKGIPERMLGGWCQKLHMLSTGYPAGRAPLEQAASKAKDKG